MLRNRGDPRGSQVEVRTEPLDGRLAVLAPQQENNERRRSIRGQEKTLPERAVHEIFEHVLRISIRNVLRLLRTVRQRTGLCDAGNPAQIRLQLAKTK